MLLIDELFYKFYDYFLKNSIPIFFIFLLILIFLLFFSIFLWQKRRKIKNEEKELVEKLKLLAPTLDLGKLSMGIIHDIRSPLTDLLMILEELLLEENRLDTEKYFFLLDMMDICLKKIIRMIELEKSELERDEGKLLYSLNKEIRRVIEGFFYSSNRAQIKITFHPDAKYRLYACRDHLNRVITNLILNAFEALEDFDIPDKHIWIYLKYSRYFISIIVKDNGPGIPQKILKEIFKPNFTSKASKGGLGLGLYLAKENMRQFFKSRIMVHSATRGKNRGACFRLKIYNEFVMEVKSLIPGQDSNLE